MRWRARRKAKKADKAFRKLHGVGAVSTPPRRRGSVFDGDDWGDVLGDLFMGALSLVFKIFD